MKNLIALLLVFAAMLILLSPTAMATEQMALDSGHACSFCHLDPGGGGELTATGAAYFEQALAAGDVEQSGLAGKLFRLLVGYLHILFAVLWFGTILYVHIVLKPAYAAQGLPRGEKLVGILSFWVVGGTGVILTLYRIDSWAQLFETRFGILLVIKVSLYLLMLISAVFVIKIIGPRLNKPRKSKYVAGEPFTAETLSSFDGQEGRSCYFAWQGKVYDASGSRLWLQGQHMKRHAAGTDLSEALALAPHKADVMERLPVVGDFDAAAVPADKDTQHFFIISYMNLGIVFIILFILALWRWG